MKKRLPTIITVLVAISLCAALLCTGITAEEQKITIIESGDYLYGIPENWSLDTLRANYTGRTYSVTDKDGNAMLGKSLVATGCKFRYEVGVGEVKELTIVVRGDTSGDGKITSTDYLKIKAYLRGKGTLEGEYLLAADIDGNGSITTVDYLDVKAYFFGNYDIYAQAPIIPDSSDPDSSFIESDDSWTSGWL